MNGRKMTGTNHKEGLVATASRDGTEQPDDMSDDDWSDAWEAAEAMALEDAHKQLEGDKAAAQAAASTASHWDVDETYPVADWQHEVANDDTRQGYQAWVASQKEMAENDQQQGKK